MTVYETHQPNLSKTLIRASRADDAEKSVLEEHAHQKKGRQDM
jgi:hypothetical protein